MQRSADLYYQVVTKVYFPLNIYLAGYQSKIWREIRRSWINQPTEVVNSKYQRSPPSPITKRKGVNRRPKTNITDAKTMGGKKDKKKKAKDPLKKAALAAKKEAKADKAALKRARKEAGKGKGNEGEGGGKGGGKGEGTAPGDDLDALLESYRSKTRELEAVELEPLEDPPFPTPPRGNSTWTLCPSDGTFYMVGRANRC